MSKIVLKNRTDYKDSDLLKIVHYCLPPGLQKSDLKIKVTIKQSKDDGWDGEADVEKNTVLVIAPADEFFPQVLDINHDFQESYFRETHLNNTTEFLIWLLSHELFHLNYNIDPKIVIIRPELQDFVEWDEETLVCVYAECILNKYRRSLF